MAANQVTSAEKHAAYKEAFFKHIAEAVKATRPDRYEALRQTNYSIVGQALKALENQGAIGAKQLNKGLLSVRKRISDADTALGAALTGKHWNASPEELKNLSRVSRFRRAMFTDSKENLVDVGDDMYKKFRTPSATAPIKEVANVAVPLLAMNEAYKIVDDVKVKKNPQGGPL
jgi:hypothetical protein